MTICYVLGEQLYVNLTNRCTNRCCFCVRDEKDGIDPNVDLWLEREPATEEIIADLAAHSPENYKEVVFCGYGEPMIRFDELIAAAKFLKKSYGSKIRINTNGHANRIHGRDVTPEMAGLVDVVSISLNAKDAAQYEKLCHCDYGEDGFREMLDFTKKCRQVIPRVILSVVDILPPEDLAACGKLAEELGVEFRVREKI